MLPRMLGADALSSFWPCRNRVWLTDFILFDLHSDFFLNISDVIANVLQPWISSLSTFAFFVAHPVGLRWGSSVSIGYSPHQPVNMKALPIIALLFILSVLP